MEKTSVDAFFLYANGSSVSLYTKKVMCANGSLVSLYEKWEV